MLPIRRIGMISEPVDWGVARPICAAVWTQASSRTFPWPTSYLDGHRHFFLIYGGKHRGDHPGRLGPIGECLVCPRDRKKSQSRSIEQQHRAPLAEIPIVLRADLYAVAGLAGAAIVVIANVLQLPSGPAALVGVALCFGLRIMAIKYGWQLPVARADDRRDKSTDTVVNRQPPNDGR
jgi:hypothetical protein